MSYGYHSYEDWMEICSSKSGINCVPIDLISKKCQEKDKGEKKPCIGQSSDFQRKHKWEQYQNS